MGTRVEGSPFQQDDFVLVVQAIDAEIYDVAKYVGEIGRVVQLDYDCGCGEQKPDDPMIRVQFGCKIEAFWWEELVLMAAFPFEPERSTDVIPDRLRYS